jgi:hypothetical protein
MSRMRSYREGRFECLAWDNVGMRALWRTRKFSGYISDYNIGDFDNDGQDEMVFAVVKKIGDPMTGEAKSYLVSWDPYQQGQSKISPDERLTQSSRFAPHPVISGNGAFCVLWGRPAAVAVSPAGQKPFRVPSRSSGSRWGGRGGSGRGCRIRPSAGAGGGSGGRPGPGGPGWHRGRP